MLNISLAIAKKLQGGLSTGFWNSFNILAIFCQISYKKEIIPKQRIENFDKQVKKLTNNLDGDALEDLCYPSESKHFLSKIELQNINLDYFT